MLDYACGTGSITKALGPLVTNVVGMDVSENMVQKYNEEAAAAGLQPEQVHAVVGDLLAEEVPDHLNTADYHNFDVVVVGLGFHHFENPLEAIKRLSARLKPESGVLLIIDFLPFEANKIHGDEKNTIQSGGFTRSNLEKLHNIAHLNNFSFSVIDEEAVMELQEGTEKRKLFISRAKRPPTAWGKFANWVYSMQVEASRQTNTMTKPQHEIPQQLGVFGQTRTHAGGVQKQKDTWTEQVQKLGYYSR